VAEAARILGNPTRRLAYQGALAVAEVKAGLLSSSPAAPTEPTPAPPVTEEGDVLASYDAIAGAEAEFAEGRYWDALQVVEVLLGGLSGRLRMRALLLRARVYSKNTKWRREAEEQLKELLEVDPANTDAFFLLGELYEEAGLSGRATAMFRKVLALKPRHPGALAHLTPGSRPGGARSG